MSEHANRALAAYWAFVKWLRTIVGPLTFVAVYTVPVALLMVRYPAVGFAVFVLTVPFTATISIELMYWSDRNSGV